MIDGLVEKKVETERFDAMVDRRLMEMSIEKLKKKIDRTMDGNVESGV